MITLILRPALEMGAAHCSRRSLPLEAQGLPARS
jgi:hypothetical protein